MIISRRHILIILLLLFMIVLTKCINLTVIILSFLLTEKIFDKFLNSQIFDTKIFRKLFIFIIYFIIFQCIILVSWLINHDFPLDQTPLLTLFTLLLLYFQQKYLCTSKVSATNGIKRAYNFSDTVSLVIAFTVLSPIFIVPFIYTHGNTEQVIAGIANEGDDRNHLEFINLRLKYNRGILYHSDAEGKKASNHPIKAVEFYPASWPSANTVIIKSIYPKVSIGKSSTDAYLISKAFWFFVVIFLYVKIIFIIYEAYNNKKQLSMPSTLWLCCAAFLTCRIFIIDIFRQGFYSFMPQIISILLTIALLLQICKQDRKNIQSRNTLLLLAIVAVGGCLPWYLMIPSLLLSLLIIYSDHMRLTNPVRFFKEIKNIILEHWLYYILLTTAVATQLFVLLARNVTGDESSLELINATSGQHTQYVPEFYIFIYLGCALYLIFINSKTEKALRYITYLFMSILILAGTLSAIQISTIGQNSYYYFKVLYAATIISLPIGIVGIAMAFNWITVKFSKNLAFSILIILVLTFIQIFQLHW